MAFAKIQLFDKELGINAMFYKALAHPARLAILKYLAEAKTCITSDFADELPLSRTTVNQHLTELKASGLINSRTKGAKTLYCLNYDKIMEFKLLSDFFLTKISKLEKIDC